MTVDTFKVDTDAEDRKFIHQTTSEHGKNYTEKDYEKGNEAQIYEWKK